MTRARGDVGDERQQAGAQPRHRAPVFIDNLHQYLPARPVRLAVETHRIGDTKAVLDRHRAAKRERAVPAHRIARDRDDVISGAVDAEPVEQGRGVDQRGRDIAAHVRRDAEAIGAVEFADRRLATLAALGVETGDDIAEARAVQPCDAAKLALAIGAAAGGDDKRGLLRRRHASSSFAAA